MAQELNLPTLSDDLTYQQAEKMIKGVIQEMNTAVTAYESWLSSAAVKYGVDVNIGDYGSGKSVVIDEYTARNYGKDIGDWVHSSETC